ncbi:hypothetical protein PANT_14c00089 [Moesziomyces antarcticus T-34]|uniref:Copper transport protein n=1 Tax=Pseudozyma antarctica (strain T-34) TaxID=1151754 RepID=M9MED3_PSEA3|nr:hypothetical protein PANT_14c00089 [Moesziomyces antarcticus T-34]
MNHGGMDHGGMEHGGHGGMDHGGMDHGATCSMNMVWNWDTSNLCILTSSWRITTPLSLYLSLSIIMLAGVGYEWLRSYIRRYDARLARSTLGPAHRRRASLRLPTTNTPPSRRSPSTAPGSSARWIQPLECSRRTQVVRSALYAASVGFSFALMLIAMTFNAFVIAAIVAGAGLGNYMFNRDLSTSQSLADDKGLACHA